MSIQYQKVLLGTTDNTITEYSVQTGTTEISPSAFINCNSLTNINMEESLFSNIGPEAFSINCKVNNENTLLSSYCSNASFSGRAIIPNNVTLVGNWAFENCSSLTSVTIPESVITLGNEMFSNCRSLTSITIPSSVICILSKAFFNCTSLTNIILENRTVEEAQSLIGTSNAIGYTGVITCDDGEYNTVYTS